MQVAFILRMKTRTTISPILSLLALAPLAASTVTYAEPDARDDGDEEIERPEHTGQGERPEHDELEDLPLRWSIDSIVLEAVVDDDLFPTTQLLSATERAAEQWNAVGAGPQIVVVQASAELPHKPKLDRHNALTFGRGRWTGVEGAAAQTQRMGNKRDGQLFEADVEVNAGEVPLCDGEVPGKIDLQSVLTHELGHVLGLPDDFENPDATMYFEIHDGDISPRTLSDVDVEKVEALYEGIDLRPATAGCSSTAADSSWLVLALAVASALPRSRRRGGPEGGLTKARVLAGEPLAPATGVVVAAVS